MALRGDYTCAGDLEFSGAELVLEGTSGAFAIMPTKLVWPDIGADRGNLAVVRFTSTSEFCNATVECVEVFLSSFWTFRDQLQQLIAWNPGDRVAEAVFPSRQPPFVRVVLEQSRLRVSGELCRQTVPATADWNVTFSYPTHFAAIQTCLRSIEAWLFYIDRFRRSP